MGARIITITVFLLAVNAAASMIGASGAFPASAAPPGFALGSKLPNTTAVSGAPPTSASFPDLIGGLVWAVSKFIEMVVQAATGLGYLVGYAIPNGPNGPTLVEGFLVGAIVAGTTLIYIWTIVQLVTGRVFQ